MARLTVPQMSTEGALLKTPARVVLFAGTAAPGAFDEAQWSAAAAPQPEGVVEDRRAVFEIPAAQWVGKEVVLGAKAFGANGKEAGWSNLAVVEVVAPPQTPGDVKAEAVPSGVRLTWQAQSGLFRVFRQSPGENGFTAAASPTAPEWIDTTTEYGKTYRYTVQSLTKTRTGEAESEPSAAVSITPLDTFPPAAPAGLTAVPAAGSIELVWEPDTEPDLAGYRVYRSAGAAPFARIAGPQPEPAYSDRDIHSGTQYRYAVTSMDRSGNESKLSAPVSVTAP